MKTEEQGMTINAKTTSMTITQCSGVSTVDFEQVNNGWIRADFLVVFIRDGYSETG